MPIGTKKVAKKPAKRRVKKSKPLLKTPEAVFWEEVNAVENDSLHEKGVSLKVSENIVCDVIEMFNNMEERRLEREADAASRYQRSQERWAALFSDTIAKFAPVIASLVTPPSQVSSGLAERIGLLVASFDEGQMSKLYELVGTFTDTQVAMYQALTIELKKNEPKDPEAV